MAETIKNINDLKNKRKRSANWDNLEKSLLKNCMKEFVDVIENKNTDTNTNKSKTIAWQTVTQRFNELNGRQRDLSEIKQQWRTMKLDAKKNMSMAKISLQLTGGGPKPPSPNQETLEIISMIPQEFETDSNVFDSDGIAEKKNNDEITPLILPMEDFITIPLNKSDNEKENITPLSRNKKPKITDSSRSKRRLPLFDEHRQRHLGTDLSNERNNVLIKCLQEEHQLKVENLIESHDFAKEEHNLKIMQMKEAHNLLKEKSQLEIEKLKLEINILKSKFV